MGVNLKFIFRASRTADSNHEVGYIYLRKTINRKVTYKSLGLPLIDKRVWDETKQRVKKHLSESLVTSKRFIFYFLESFSINKVNTGTNKNTNYFRCGSK